MDLRIPASFASENIKQQLSDQNNKYVLALIIAASIVITLYFNLFLGIDVVYTHFYYVPIILTGIWYYRKAVYLALALGATHMVIGYLQTGTLIPSTAVRAVMFVVVALIVATLSKSRNRLYREVSDSKSSLNTILNSVYDGIIIHELDGRIVDVNDRMLEMFGLDRKELKSISVSADLSGQGSPRERLEEIWREVGDGQDRLFDWVSRRPHDGTEFDTELFLRGIRLRGSPYIMATIRDIARRKLAEEEKLELARYIGLLLESTDQGIFGVDTEGRCTIINRSGSQIIGYEPWEIIGKNVHDLIHYLKRDGTPCHRSDCCIYQSMISGKGCRIGDELFWRKDEVSFPVEYSSFPIVEDGQIRGSVVTFNDITERREAQEKIRDARVQAELYLDLMGHDINNLNQIGIGYLEEALETLPIPEENQLLITRPLEALYNSSKLINNVRMLQVIKEGNIKLKPVEAGSLLSEVVREYRHVPGREVQIRYDQTTCCTVMANDLLQDVFSNLLGNAVKHSEGPLTIEISADRVLEKDAEYCRVAIADNGPGIPDEAKVRIFDRFHRGKTRAAGKGLGLYIVKSLIESFGGRVWAEDRVPGDPSKGARFILLIPLACTPHSQLPCASSGS